jgi:hypothetical protein
MSIPHHNGRLRALLALGFKLAEYAPGIPDKSRVVPLPDIRKPTTWKLSIQEHNADRAGKHLDLRLVDPRTGHAHSWAIPRAELPAPGKAVLAIQQPTHTADYALNFGKNKVDVIPEGYGKGSVRSHTLADADVFHSTPAPKGTRVRFNVYKSKGPEEYAIVRMGNGSDLLVNKTLTRERVPQLLLGEKPKTKEVDVTKVNPTSKDEVWMPKYDGAHTLVLLSDENKIPRLFSYRIPKKHTAGLIEHTHKAPDLLVRRVPKDLKNTVLRAETIGITSEGKAIPASDVAGLLNATVTNSRERQKELNAKLVPVLFDIESIKGKSVQHLPFEERYKLLKGIGERLQLPVTDTAFDTATKEKLLKHIREGKHPHTSEGVMIQSLSTNSPAQKAKFRPDHDVYVREIFEAVDARGKGLGRAGGFEYSWTPRGPIVGRVGTGFDHALARDMFISSNKYTGRVAKVDAERKNPSGSLSKPSFIAWHVDKGKQL